MYPYEQFHIVLLNDITNKICSFLINSLYQDYQFKKWMKQQNRNKEEYKTLKPSRLVGTTCRRFNALNKLEYDSRRNKHIAFPKKWLKLNWIETDSLYENNYGNIATLLKNSWHSGYYIIVPIHRAMTILIISNIWNM